MRGTGCSYLNWASVMPGAYVTGQQRVLDGLEPWVDRTRDRSTEPRSTDG
jgi:hypothetical protein